ncbi:diacylglycerol kinase family protein [Candidatus Uhrbacteria bacterium]|nr:diacylglycerol kinase family protein [Candidatus Uhrbacteria bacterium]
MKSPSFFRRLRYAARGLSLAFQSEQSFRLQSLAAVFVIVAALIFPLSILERLILLVVVMSVLVLELLNSCVERVADLMKPRLDEYVREVKDVMAGAVLLASLFSLLIALLIFGPYLLALVHTYFL